MTQNTSNEYYSKVGNFYCQYNRRPGKIIIRDRYWNIIKNYRDGATDNVRARIKWLENDTDLLAQYGRVQYEIEYEK